MALDRAAAVRAFETVAAQLGPTVEQDGGRHALDRELAHGRPAPAGRPSRGGSTRASSPSSPTAARPPHAIGYASEAGVEGIHLLGARAFSALGMLTADLVHSFDRARPMSTPFGAENSR